MIGTEEASIAWSKGFQKPGQHFRRRPQHSLRPVNTLLRLEEFRPKPVAPSQHLTDLKLETWQANSVDFAARNLIAQGATEAESILKDVIAAELIAAKSAGAYWRP